MLSEGLAVQPDPLPPDFAEAISRVRPRLDGGPAPVLFFSTIGSTNDVAAALAEGGHEGAVVIADAQTAGRGRRGRTWFSPPGAGLYVSIVLPATRAQRDRERATALVTLAAGVALVEGVERATGLRPDIKWPNDLLVRRRKLAGILAEAVDFGSAEGVQAVVLGYGINVSETSYPPALRDLVTCVAVEAGTLVDRARLCAETLAAVAERHRDLMNSRFDVILDAWRARAPGHEGARVSWDTPVGPREGVTIGIDHMGALLVRTDQRVERLVAGEVHWHN